MTRLHDLFDQQGQSPWLDNLRRDWITSGELDRWVERGVRISAMSRHAVALFQNVPGARLWRRHISEHAGKCSNAQQLIDEALGFVTRPERRTA